MREVPAEIREDCDEYYLDPPTARRVYADAEDTISRRVELEIKRYPA